MKEETHINEVSIKTESETDEAMEDSAVPANSFQRKASTKACYGVEDCYLPRTSRTVNSLYQIIN